MKKLSVLLLATLMLVVCAQTFADVQEREMVVKIQFADRDTAYETLRPLRLTYEDVQANWARAIVSPAIKSKIESMGFGVEVIWDDVRKRSEFRRQEMGERWTSYAATVSEMQTIASNYPDIVRLHNIGQSVQNRDIWVMEITDNPDTDETDEPEVRMAGNIHGDEFMSFEIMRLLMDYLTTNYGTDPFITEMVNTREIWVIPSINPDGHENGTRSNANGVDMNRNHGYMWASGGGSGPFSEPELQVFREWSLERNFTTSLSFHGETTYFNYTWNFTGEDCPDKQLLIDLGNFYVIDNGYTVTEGWDWYQTNGDTNDWSYGCRGSLDVTIETPHYSETYIQQEFDENINGIMKTIEIAGYGLAGVVTGSDTGLPLEAVVTVHQANMPVFTDPIAGDYHRTLQEGTYDITVWANGYAPQTVTGLFVPDEGVTVQNFSLVPNYTHNALQVAWTSIDYYYESNTSSWPDFMWPHNALGPADNIPASLGENNVYTYDMGENFVIEDMPGNDLIIYEAASAGDGDESCDVYGSTGGFLGPWVFIGTATGTTEFDLAGTGLDNVQYIKLEDDDNGTTSGNYHGYDLDAIAAISAPEGCGIISLDEMNYTCDDVTVTITLVDSDLNTNPGTIETFDVVIDSDSEPAGELVTLTEASADSDTFVGTITISEINSMGVLQVDRDDIITATYDDLDCEGTPRTVTDTATALCADPVLVYSSYAIDDSAGDADGILDPGETAVMSLVLSNTGDEDATNVTAVITSDMPQYVTINDGNASFPDIVVGGTEGSEAPHYSVTINASTPDHTMVTFTVTALSDDSSTVSTFQSEITTSTFAQRYTWDMSVDPGWSTAGDWEWGVPQGNDGDPSSGYTGSNVYGYNLAGDYTNGMDETFLTTAAINCANLEAVELRFMRWLGVESSSYDHASVKVSTNGSSWTDIWDHSSGSFTDDDWQEMTYDISAYADGEETVYIAWVMGETDSSVTYCGWNIDDVEIWAESSVPPTPTPNPCNNDGDTNLDGSITAGDAQMAFQIALGLITPTYDEECAADCTGDSSVTAGDAQQIFMTALGTASCADPM